MKKKLMHTSLKHSVMIGLFLLGGCDSKNAAPPLPGERLSIMAYDKFLKPDPMLENTPIILPHPILNTMWLQPGGSTGQNLPPLALEKTLKKKWSRSIGEGSNRRNRLMVEPIATATHIYTMDSNYLVTCLRFEDGERVWEKSVAHEENADSSLGGGLAIDNDVLYITTAVGDVVALDVQSGREIWRTSLGVPVRAAPLAADSRIFVVTLNNTLEVLDQNNGESLWTHAGVSELASVLGSSAPVISKEILVVPYSSGELVALSAITKGEQVWSDNLANMSQRDGLMSLAHIRARPIIDGNKVYAISYSGRMVCLDLETGNGIWEQEIGGHSTPAIGGEFLFLVTSDGQMVSIQKTTGKIKWVRDLNSLLTADTNDSGTGKPDAHWIGPLIAGDTLIVAGSDGKVLRLSPETGDFITGFRAGEKISISPIVVNNSLILMGDDGHIHLYQ